MIDVGGCVGVEMLGYERRNQRISIEIRIEGEVPVNKNLPVAAKRTERGGSFGECWGVFSGCRRGPAGSQDGGNRVWDSGGKERIQSGRPNPNPNNGVPSTEDVFRPEICK